MEPKGVAVVAVGGNSLIKDETHRTVPDQIEAGRESMRHIVDMIEQGWNVVITHGNGPQVGFILRRSELSRHELHDVPLDFCGADSQGAIGFRLKGKKGLLITFLPFDVLMIQKYHEKQKRILAKRIHPHQRYLIMKTLST